VSGQVSGQPSWSYDELARAALADATRVLDLDTGGGEHLASLTPLPKATIATEGYQPNLPVARERLAPLGVDVRQHVGKEPLPRRGQRGGPGAESTRPARRGGTRPRSATGAAYW